MIAVSDGEKRDGSLAREDGEHDRAVDQAVAERVEHGTSLVAAMSSCARNLSEGFAGAVIAPLTTNS